MLEHSDFIYLVANGEMERDFIKFGRCKGRFNGKSCKHKLGVRVSNVIIDQAHNILEPDLMAGQKDKICRYDYSTDRKNLCTYLVILCLNNITLDIVIGGSKLLN